jgi:UrcA family protein
MSPTKTQFPSRLAGALAAVAAVAATAIGIAAGVQGQSGAPSAPHRLRVAYTALDLSQPMGAQLLYHRLQQASSNACGTLAPVDVGAYLAWQRCYDGTLQRAVLAVNAPQLLALYRNDAARPHSAG